MKRLLHSAWVAASRRRHRRFVEALADPRGAQRERLRAVLDAVRGSALAHRHGLDAAADLRTFRRRVPITDFASFAPSIDRIRHGEAQVLTRAPVERFLPTSGTTAGPKLVPVTALFREEVRAAVDPWIVDLYQRHPGLRRGSAYWSVSPAFELDPALRKESAVPIGFESDTSYLGPLARLADRVLAAPTALRHARPLESFRYATLLSLLRRRDLALVSVWHPSFFTLLLDTRANHWKRLLHDVRCGTFSAHVSGPRAAEVRRAMRARPDPRRAAMLRALGPHAAPTDLWPRLQVVSAWADASAAGPARALADQVAPAHFAPKGLVATEAMVTIPFRGAHPVALTSHFVELLDARGEAHEIADAALGETYEVVVTTGSGLLRVRLGDRVQVTGRLGATPTLRFLGRGDRTSDRVGEKLHEAFVGQVVRALAPDARFAMLAPHERGYALFCDRPVDAAALDARLCANPHYAYARELGQLTAPRVLRVGPDAHHRALRRLQAEGTRLGDIKPTHLDARDDWSRFLLDPPENPHAPRPARPARVAPRHPRRQQRPRRHRAATLRHTHAGGSGSPADA